MSNYSRIFLIIIIFGITGNARVYSQKTTKSDSISSNKPNNAVLKIDKYVNTYIFLGNFNFNKVTDFGTFDITQTYTGSAIRSSDMSFRDDEELNFSYNYPITDFLLITNNENWLYTSDSRSIGLGELQRINAASGLKLIFFDDSYISSSLGIESNSQLSVNSSGYLANAIANLESLDLDGYIVDTRIFAEKLKLEDNRNNSDVYVNTNISKTYSPTDNFNLLFNYRQLGRDFLTKINDPNLNNFNVENRLEGTSNGALSFNFQSFEIINIGLDFSYSQKDVSRQFNDFYEDNTQTGIIRNLSELNLGFATKFEYRSDIFTQSAFISYDYRNEDNSISNKYNISQAEFNRLNSLDNQRDNTSNRTNLILLSKYNLSPNDTIIGNYSASILRYDTPSKENNDDRDEFTSFISIKYYKHLSPILDFEIKGELQMKHFVYLKSQRSALNNWNRILSLSPAVKINSEYFSMHPKLELIANYTIYDFEKISPSVKSYSFRQIGYRDSISFKINHKAMITSKILFRYYERGILYWTDFSETPQTSNFEQFSNLLFAYNIMENTRISIGARYYNLSQGNMRNTPKNNFIQYSYGPEVSVNAEFKKYGSINVSGWYEFRNINEKISKFANIFLETKIIL